MIIKLTIKLFLAITLLSACSLKFTNSDISLDEQEKFFSKLTSVKAIKASLDIKATGLLGNFFHEQGQIIVQEPQNLFFFINTSVGIPSVLLACNNSFLTMYNYLQNGEYSSYPITKNSYFSLYDSIIYPEILMDLMLNRIDIKNMIDISILESKDYYQVLATKEQWQVKAKIEKNRHIITEIFWHKINAKLQYHVFYDNFSIVNGIYFPHEMVFKTVNIDKSSSFKFLLNEVILNEPYQDEGIFYLKAPQ